MLSPVQVTRTPASGENEAGDPPALSPWAKNVTTGSGVSRIGSVSVGSDDVLTRSLAPWNRAASAEKVTFSSGRSKTTYPSGPVVARIVPHLPVEVTEPFGIVVSVVDDSRTTVMLITGVHGPGGGPPLPPAWSPPQMLHPLPRSGLASMNQPSGG